MLEPIWVSVFLATLLLYKRRREEKGFRPNFELVRKILETNSIVRGIYYSGSRNEVSELVRGRLPKVERDPLVEYLQEATKIGRRAVLSSPEVHRYLRELEDIMLKMEGIDKALKFRGRVMSLVLALVIPAIVRVMPVITAKTTASVGLMGEIWMGVMVLISTYFMTLDFRGRSDMRFLALPLLMLSLSNYFVARTLEPLLLRVLISPLEFIKG